MPSLKRRYDMTGRGRAAERTRLRILQAAHALLNQGEDVTLTLQEVAARAGVTRATLYQHVGSRRGLLSAVFEDQGRLMAFDRVVAAARLEDPARAVLSTLREGCRAWAVMPDAIRRTLALAVIDAEVGALVRKYEGYRVREMAALARRAWRAGVFAAGLGARDAAATLALVTGFPTFDQLRIEHGARAATRHLVRIATASLGLAAPKA